MKKKPKKKPVTFLAERLTPATLYLNGVGYDVKIVEKPELKLNLN